MKHIIKIYNNLITDLYKIDLFRTSWVLMRFFYFYHIRKNIKFFINENKKIDEHIIINRDNKKHTVISHNMHFAEDIKNLKKTYRKFDGSKTVSITYPLKSLDFINFQKAKLLSIGPRNEGELYLIRSLGFEWRNIKAIDLISYSNKVDLGDIHKTNYMNNEFDILICGWVLSYSNNFGTALDEMLRITNDKGIISIGFTYIPKEKDKVRQFDKPDNVLESTSQILDKMKENIDHVYFNFDAKQYSPDERRHSILIFRIKKDERHL